MFTAGLFTIDKTLKQPKCPSTEEWIKRCNTHTHTHIHTHICTHTHTHTYTHKHTYTYT